MDAPDLRQRIRALRQETADLRRVTDAKIERANEGIQRADARIAELRAAVSSSVSERDAACANIDLQLAVLAREQYVLLRKEGDMRDRIDRCDRELDELERSVG